MDLGPVLEQTVSLTHANYLSNTLLHPMLIAPIVPTVC